MNNDMYSMKLNEQIDLDRQTRVIRVPGGWVYSFSNEQVGGHYQEATVFVPFDNEFHEVTKEKDPF